MIQMSIFMAQCLSVMALSGPGLNGPDPMAFLLPQKPGFHRLYFNTTIEGQPRRVAYVVFLPKNYVEGGKFPVFVPLCGAGEVGDNHEALFSHIPIAALNRSKELADWADFIVVAPQCPPGLRWESKGVPAMTIDVIRYAKRQWKIDPDRVYLTGLSMGGTGTWHVMLQSPKTFAAIAPISANAVEPAKAALVTKDMTVWIICGGADNNYTTGSRLMYQTLLAKGVDVLHTEVPGEGHSTWSNYYANKLFYEFMMYHRRGQKPPQNRPIKEQLLKIGYTNPNSQDNQLAPAFKTFLPYWILLNCGAQMQPGLRPEIDGVKNVFVTHPMDAQTPCEFLTTVDVPPKKITTLNMTVGHAPKGSWQLGVRVHTEEFVQDLLRQTIGPGDKPAVPTPPANPAAPPANPAGPPADPSPPAPDKTWEDVSLDLTAFAGQKIEVEVLNYPGGSGPAVAYWGKVEVLHVDPPKPPPADWPFASLALAGAVVVYLAGKTVLRRRQL